MKRLLSLFLAVCLICAGTTLAIDVPDGDFDSTAVADGGWGYIKDIGSAWTGWYYSGDPWVGNNYSYAGYSYPGMGHSGASWVDLNAGYISQALTGETYVEGTTYELSTWINTTAEGQGLYLYFLVGDWDAELAYGYHDVAVEADLSSWSQYSFEYTATAEDAGKTIGIALYGRGETYADTIALTPEPMTLGLLGLGALMIRRRKR